MNFSLGLPSKKKRRKSFDLPYRLCVGSLYSWFETWARSRINAQHFLRPVYTICIASQCHFSSLRKIQFYLPLFHIQTIVLLIVSVLFVRFYAFLLFYFCHMSVYIDVCMFDSLTLDEIEYNFHTKISCTKWTKTAKERLKMSFKKKNRPPFSLLLFYSF